MSWFLNLPKKRLVALAVLIRILLIPFFFHPDIRTYNFQSQFLEKGVFNIYEYLLENREKLPLKEEFVYFPLTYFFIGGYQSVISPILGNEFANWLSGSKTDYIFRYLFFLKLPYLILDISVAFLLYKYFDKKEEKIRRFSSDCSTRFL